MIHGKLKLSVLSRLAAFQGGLRASFQNVLIKTILILQFAVVMCVGAQEPATEVDLSQPLTLEQCIQIGLERSTSMRNARLNLAMQELRVKNVRARYFPQIFANGNYDFSDRLDFGFEPENYNLGCADNIHFGIMDKEREVSHKRKRASPLLSAEMKELSRT